MGVLPTGHVTFLFTDIEQSTRSWETDASAMERALARHDEILRDIVSSRAGYVFSTAGDGFAVAFADAREAVQAAEEAQKAISDEAWPGELKLRIRIGVHAGNAQERDANYFGPTVNRAARVMDAAHGGQVLLSHAAAEAAGRDGLLDHGRHWLKDLPTPERLWELVTDPSAAFPPPRTLGSGSATNLPTSEDVLIGRSDDIGSLRGLLAHSRLVTICGVGGIGKTRLALETARAQIEDFDDGVWWCELAPVGEPAAVAQTVAQVLSARQHPGRTMVESIAEFCRRRRLFLVLDNCEHVLDAASELVAAVLAVAADVSVLATSREALGCTGEQTFPLRSLAVGGEDSPASELFVRRAEQVDPGRRSTPEEMGAITRICQRLDGMPLAIELAAGRVRSLSPVEIEERLDTVFRVLRGGRRSIERHRTLSAAIDWSYQLLDPIPAKFFERLSVFAGGWDLAAAETVCSDDEEIEDIDVAELLDDLVSKSLVVIERGARGRSRYRLLEPLRQYAEDRLAACGNVVALRDRHAACFCAWAETWKGTSWSDELAWRMAIDTEFANLRTAVAWAIDAGNADLALRTCAALDRAQAPFLRLEIGQWAARALALPAVAEHPLVPDVCRTAASSAWWRGDLPSMFQHIELGESSPHYDPCRVHTNQLRALCHALSGHPEAALEVLDRVQLDDPETGLVPWFRTSLSPDPRPEDVEVLRSFARRTGSVLSEIIADQAEAWSCYRAGDLARSATLHRRVIERSSEVGAPYFAHLSIAGLGSTAGAVGQLTTSDLGHVHRSLREQRDCGQEVDQWLVLMTGAVALLQHRRAGLAEDIHRALYTSPWAETWQIAELDRVFFGGRGPGDLAADPPPVLATIVDSTLTELAAILAESEATSGDLPRGATRA